MNAGRKHPRTSIGEASLRHVKSFKNNSGHGISPPGTPDGASAARTAERAAIGFLDLPDEIIHRIFAHFEPAPELCRLMKVCTKFADVAGAPELWKHVKAVDPILRHHSKYNNDGVYENLKSLKDFSSQKAAKKRPKRPKRAVRKERRKGVGLAVDVVTSRAGSHLVSLDLEDFYSNWSDAEYKMSDADLKVIATRSSKSLQTLLISASLLVTGRGLADFAKSCSQLRTLHMTASKNLTDKIFGAIVQTCPTLEDISVARCRSFRGARLHDNLRPIRGTLKRLDLSVTLISRIYACKFMCDYPALEELHAGGCEVLSERDGQLPPGNVSCFPRLGSLNLDSVYVVSAVWLRHMLSQGSRLRLLSLNMLHSKIHFLQDIFDVTWPPLKYLGLSGQPIKDAMWQCIFEKLGATLVQCDMSRNILLTGSVVVLNNETFAELEELNLSWTGATDNTVKVLMNIAPKLKFLALTACRGVELKLRQNPLALKRGHRVEVESSSTV